jgi:hypothetical protein
MFAGKFIKCGRTADGKVYQEAIMRLSAVSEMQSSLALTHLYASVEALSGQPLRPSMDVFIDRL